MSNGKYLQFSSSSLLLVETLVYSTALTIGIRSLSLQLVEHVLLIHIHVFINSFREILKQLFLFWLLFILLLKFNGGSNV